MFPPPLVPSLNSQATQGRGEEVLSPVLKQPPTWLPLQVHEEAQVTGDFPARPASSCGSGLKRGPGAALFASAGGWGVEVASTWPSLTGNDACGHRARLFPPKGCRLCQRQLAHLTAGVSISR